MPVRVCHWNRSCQLTLFRRTYELDDGQVRSLIFLLRYDTELPSNSKPGVFFAGYASSAVVEAIL